MLLTLTTTSHAPAIPSLLSIPPSPTSPISPIRPATPHLYLTGSCSSSTSFTSFLTSSKTLTIPPSLPLPWHWQCHVCHRTYSLATTRRCLDDGHLFCSGEPLTSRISTKVSKRCTNGDSKGGKSGKRGRTKAKSSCKRGKACASEFDYAGWKAWGEWRRNELAVRAHTSFVPSLLSSSSSSSSRSSWSMTTSSSVVPTPRCAATPTSSMKGKKRNCQGQCDYPSECRWGPLSVQSKSPVTPYMPVSPVSSVVAPEPLVVGPSSCSMSNMGGILDGMVMKPNGQNEMRLPATSFEEILGLLCDADKESSSRNGDDHMADVKMEGAYEGLEKEQHNPLCHVQSHTGVDLGDAGTCSQREERLARAGYLPAWLRV